MTKTAAQLVSEAKQHIENLTPEQFEAEIAMLRHWLSTSREPDERSQNGTIRAAVHAARGMLEFYADPASPQGVRPRPTDDPVLRLRRASALAVESPVR